MKDYRIIHTNKVYVFYSEGLQLIKIGKSGNIENRLDKLNCNITDKSNYFVLVDFVSFENSMDAGAFEKYLHYKYSNYQSLTNISGAKTECFLPKILPDVLLELKNNISRVAYDPFVFVNIVDAEIILGTTSESLIDMLNLKHTENVSRKLKKVMRNIAANILIAEGKVIYYTERILAYIAPSHKLSSLVFNHFLADGVFLTTHECSFTIHDMRLQERKLSYRKLSVDYLLKIPSLNEYTLKVNSHIKYKEAVMNYCKSKLGETNGTTIT